MAVMRQDLTMFERGMVLETRKDRALYLPRGNYCSFFPSINSKDIPGIGEMSDRVRRRLIRIINTQRL